jgi:DNA-binding response OmpR family regulator
MRIVILSTDPELSLLRQHALRNAGHETLVPVSDNAMNMALDDAGEHYDVALLCHRIPDGRARDLIRRYLRKNPLGKVVAVVHLYGEWPQIEADRYVVGTDGPETLLRVMSEIANERATATANAS